MIHNTAKKLKWSDTLQFILYGENKIITHAVNINKLYQCHFLQDIRIIYHNNHIIAALTTGAVSHTISTKNIIKQLIIIICNTFGKYFTKNHINIINIVILNQLTAIKCVNPELLKSCFISSDKLSLAHNNIHQRNIASFFGYIL